MHRALPLLLTLWAVPGAAQPFQPEQRLLLWEGTLRGSPRMMGLAGAYVAIAEGAEGLTRNPVSAVSRDAHFEADWAFDMGGTMHFLFPGATRSQDWDNDGRPEQVDGPFHNLGTQVLYTTVRFRFKSFAIGLGFDDQNFIHQRQVDGEAFERFYNLNLIHGFAALSGSFWNDQIQLGLGVETTHALLGYWEQTPGAVLPTPKDAMGWHGWGVLVGGLWRPEHQDYRVGFAFRPAVNGRPHRPRASFNGLNTFSEVSAPARLSLGAVYALGWGRKLNITSPDGWEELEAVGKDGKKERSPAQMKFLITFQLDVFFPVENASSVTPFLEQPDVDAAAAGYNVSFEPRLGIEKEVVRDRLRLWLGGYLEPPMALGGVLRPHVTFGGELFLFKVGRLRLSFGLAMDFASRYQNMSLALMLWN